MVSWMLDPKERMNEFKLVTQQKREEVNRRLTFREKLALSMKVTLPPKLLIKELHHHPLVLTEDFYGIYEEYIGLKCC